jgi:integrase/recombinase XerD
MLTIYRRHLKTCDHQDEGRRYRRCKCPIWVDGQLNGAEIRKSLDLRDWTKAQEQVREWEVEGKVVHTKDTSVTIEQLCRAFISDATARRLAPSSVRKYQQSTRQLLQYAEQVGVPDLSQWDVSLMRKFRESWKDSALTTVKKLERFRSLFRLAQENHWITENPAAKIKNPVVKPNPTMPYTASEMSEILEACDHYRGDTKKIRAFVLLMRYSGLRVGDAARLARERISDGKLFLYTAKTGTPVWVPLPPVVIDALGELPPGNQRYFFWTGESSPDTVAKLWMRNLQDLFRETNIVNAHSHRFRDTFAVEMLLSGVPMERVSILLGHSSIKVTEKHYAPWVMARQQQLEADVLRSWEHDPLAKGTPGVHGKSNVLKF